MCLCLFSLGLQWQQETKPGLAFWKVREEGAWVIPAETTLEQQAPSHSLADPRGKTASWGKQRWLHLQTLYTRLNTVV